MRTCEKIREKNSTTTHLLRSQSTTIQITQSITPEHLRRPGHFIGKEPKASAAVDR